MGSGFIEALQTVKVRYPGQPAATPLKKLIRENKLTDLLTQQYPDITKPGHVQFVPETRGYSKTDRNPGHVFLNQQFHQQHVLDQHGTHIAGIQHEIAVQDCFGNLRNSALICNRSLVVLHNMGAATIWHSKLKNAWNREFDIVVVDSSYGVFICEVKSRAYQTLRDSTNKKYSLVQEQDKQIKRYKMFSEIREFLGSAVPIHTLLICNSTTEDPYTRLIEEETQKMTEQDFKFVINLSLSDDFQGIWSDILCHILCNSVTDPDSSHVLEFTALLYAIQTVDELQPSKLHHKFTHNELQLEGVKQGKKKGKAPKKGEEKSESSILWTREQRTILDQVNSFFSFTELFLLLNKAGGDARLMRLCISGCMGSGKTLLLMKFAEMFSHMYPKFKTLFLVEPEGSTTSCLLLENLSSTHQPNVKYANTGEYSSYNYSTKKHTLLSSCSDYQLILVDEYFLPRDSTLDVSNITNSHLAVVTSFTNVTDQLHGFTRFSLSGSLRATKQITEFVMQAQEKGNTSNKLVPVRTLHNVAYKPVEITHVSTGAQCVETCFACLKDILATDSSATIMLISAVHRNFLYQISVKLQEQRIPHIFRHHTMGLPAANCEHQPGSGSNITLCDSVEAIGCESAAVIHVSCENNLPAGYKAAAANYISLAISRSTTIAHVFVIDTIYNECMPLIPVLPAAVEQIPCSVHLGETTPVALIQYLDNLVNKDMVRWRQQYPGLIVNKKILVAYRRDAETIVNNIKEALPSEIVRAVVFSCTAYTSFDNLDLAADFILVLHCYYSTYTNQQMFTTLPVTNIRLVAGNVSSKLKVVTARTHHERRG